MRLQSQELLIMPALPAPALIDATRCQLAAETLRRGAPVEFRTLGTSMMPAIWPGDRLRFVPARVEDVEPGQVVLLFRADRLVAHRVVEKPSAGVVITRGDALSDCDAPVRGDELVGKLVRIVPSRAARVRIRAARVLERLKFRSKHVASTSHEVSRP